MEYGTQISEAYHASYIGMQNDNNYLKNYFSEKNIKNISNKITDLLAGVDPDNRPIVVTDKNIINVMTGVYESYRPQNIGSIYGKHVATPESGDDIIRNMTDQTIEIIVTDVRDNLGMEECNKKLTIWTTVMGDFNDHSLRRHAPIKIQKKRPNPFEFHMHY